MNPSKILREHLDSMKADQKKTSLTELLSKNLNSYTLADSLQFMDKNLISKDTKIDTRIVDFLEKLKQEKPITSSEFDEFNKQLNNINNSNIKNMIIHLAFTISQSIHESHEQEITAAVSRIETSIKNSQAIPQQKPNEASFIGLVNIYHLLAMNNFYNEGDPFNRYPGVNAYERNLLCTTIPFAINALSLVGKLPKTKDFHGMNLTKPLYPLGLEIIRGEKEELRKGVKDSNEYYPFKQVNKIAVGDTGDNTFIATNGRKILFVRGVEEYSPDAILASKIATLVSAQHFSSERLLDNRVVASRGITTYACSVADRKTYVARKQYIETEKRVFPGSGIIDEVTNYVREGDPNIENLGFSSTDIAKSHLSKIDFDRCSFKASKGVSKENYDQDIITKHGFSIYHGAEHVQKDPGYVQEKLYARLKLSMLPKPLLEGLAEKAFIKKQQRKKENAIQECIQRSNIALELFLEHNEAEAFIKQNPQMLNRCYAEITVYIKEHFAEKDQPRLLASLKERVEHISAELAQKLSVPEVPLQLSEEVTSTKYKKANDSKVSQAISGEIEQRELSQDTPEVDGENNFLSRNWLKLAGIALFVVVGTAIGIALTATGVLAPAGLGVLGYTVGTAIGFGAGLAAGTATLGSKIIYDEYQFKSSQDTAQPSRDTAIRPSSGIADLGQKFTASNKEIETQFSQIDDKLQAVRESSQKLVTTEEELTDTLQNKARGGK